MTSPRDATRATSLVDRMFWAAWQIGKGRPPTIKDIHDPAVIRQRDEYRKCYLPEVRRAQK